MWMMSRPISGVLSTFLTEGWAAIHLSDLPWECLVSETRGPRTPTFDLAPGGVYQATLITQDAGALLPHRFTLTCSWSPRPSAVCSLWHFPAGHPDWPLASTLPYGVPTFLDPTPVEGVTSFRNEPRPPGRLTVDLMFSQTGGSFPALSQPRSSLSPWHLLPQCPRPDLKDRSGQRYRSASSTVGSIVPFVRRSRASCGCRGRSGPSR